MFRSLIANFNVLNVSHLARRNAGHSKWANIKHDKALKDSKRSELFGKLAQKIKVAIRDGGSTDPAKNMYLAQAIEQAKKASMPLSSINNSIIQNEKSKAESFWYEIRGPKGSLLIVLALTDNHVRLKQEIAVILRKIKHKANFSSTPVRGEFDQKGIVTAIPPHGVENIDEAVVDHAIECGAEEVNPCEVEDGVYKFVCELNDMQRMRSKLQNLNYKIESAEFEFIPKLKVVLDDEDIEFIQKLISKLEDIPEIVRIHDNIA